MTTPDTAYRDPLEARARRRVKIKLGFATHLFIYVCVNLGLWLISLGGLLLIPAGAALVAPIVLDAVAAAEGRVD